MPPSALREPLSVDFRQLVRMHIKLSASLRQGTRKTEGTPTETRHEECMTTLKERITAMSNRNEADAMTWAKRRKVLAADLRVIAPIVRRIRRDLQREFDLPLFGRSNEANDRLIPALREKGYDATAREGWYLFDDQLYGEYFRHSWCEIRFPDDDAPVVVDITGDQYDAGMFWYVPRKFIGHLPRYLSYEEPEVEYDEIEDPETRRFLALLGIA